MDNAVWGMLNDTEKALLRRAERGALAELDEGIARHLRHRRHRCRESFDLVRGGVAGDESAGESLECRANLVRTAAHKRGRT